MFVIGKSTYIYILTYSFTADPVNFEKAKKLVANTELAGAVFRPDFEGLWTDAISVCACLIALTICSA